MDLTEGARYSTFEDLEDAIAKFSQDTNSVYTVYNSKSIEAENRNRPPEKHLPACLKYRSIKFACKHYGATRSKSRGLRPNQSSFKIGCPSFIYVAAHTNELVVEKIERFHSHTCDPELVNFYPERRSLAHLGNDRKDNKNPETTLLKTVRDDVLDLLRIGVDRRRIRNYVHIRTKRLLWTGDLNNLAKQAREQTRFVSQERTNQLLNQLKTLESKENVPQINTPGNMKEKLNSLKRKVPSDPRPVSYNSVKTEPEDKGSDEHCYSAPTKVSKITRISRNESQDTGQGSSEVTHWDQHNLEEVVKSILGPNQEGPFIVHLNNYDGVAVVEVSDGHSTGDSAQHSNVQKDERDLEESFAHCTDSVEESNDQSSEKEDGSIKEVSVIPPECTLGATDDDGHAGTPPNRQGILSKNFASPKKTFVIRKISSPITQTTKSKTPDATKIITVSSSSGENSRKPQKVVKLYKKNECVTDVPSVQNQKSGFGAAPHTVISLSDAENEPLSDVNSSDDDDDEEIYDSQVSCASSEFERTLENEQLLLLQTKQAKLKEEKNVFKLKAQKLKLQIRSLNNSLEQQTLEKEKVRLEIKLLRIQLEEKQKQVRRGLSDAQARQK